LLPSSWHNTLTGLEPTPEELEEEAISVTSPFFSSNTHPVAGTIATPEEVLPTDAVTRELVETGNAVNRVSDHTTSLLRKSSGLGGKPPRPVTINSLPFYKSGTPLSH
jgi:hypothetical protein